MRNAGNLLESTSIRSLGMDGGGWVTGLAIANDGWMTSRNDTIDGHIRGPAETVWRPAFKAAETYSDADQVFKNPAQRCYDICPAPSNSLVIYAWAMGRFWKTTDRGFNWSKTGFKGGALDTTITNDPVHGARIGGKHIAVHPTNPDIVAAGHPADGLYYSTDGGTTVTLHPDIPAPTSHKGVHVHFVSGTEVIAVSEGNGTYRSTTGVAGSFALVSGGPTTCNDIASGGGKTYIVGSGIDDDGQLYVSTGAAFSAVSGVTGITVDVDPNNTARVFVLRIGGGMWWSTDTGANFTLYDVIVPKVATDVPWLAWTKVDYLAVGQARFSCTEDAIIITCGIGVFKLANPPQTVGHQLVSMTEGIKQLLPMAVVCTPNSKVIVPVQDRVAMVFDIASAHVQAARHAPNALFAIRHGGAPDYAIDDPRYWAIPSTAGSSQGFLTRDEGVSWSALATIPTYVHPTEGVQPFTSGNMAIGNAGNIVWLPTNNIAPKYTLDHGETWDDCDFAGMDLTGSYWHNAYYVRRCVLAADKDNPGTFYLFCTGNQANDATDPRGIWKSTDGGATWTRTYAGYFTSFSADFWQCKLRLVPGHPGSLFWCRGIINGYPTPPAADGLIFSPDEGVTRHTLTGWEEPEDIALGAPAMGAAFPSIYVVGWRSGVHGLWRCIDFNPATRAGTWTNLAEWPLGRPDYDCVVGADPVFFGRAYVGFAGGGGIVVDRFRMRLSA